MVTPRDAERIALAQSEGTIMLVLRNPLDTDSTPTAGIQTAALLGPGNSAAPPPAVDAGAPKARAAPRRRRRATPPAPAPPRSRRFAPRNVATR